MRIDGFLTVDKPEGISSLDVVRKIKRRFAVQKAGHIGTLDPFATGVLPIAVNEGTKLIPFLTEEPKGYEGTLKLGEETDTEDLTGKVLSRRSWEGISRSEIEQAFQSFLGRIHQVPPMFSAIKVGGKPLYRLARKGQEIERKGRDIHILDLQIEEVELPRIRFRVSCSRGTYIRTLAKDLGQKIGCGAHLIQLRRVQSGLFTLRKAISWEALQRIPVADLGSWLTSLEEALPGTPEVLGNPHLIRKVLTGREMRVGDLCPQSLSEFDSGTVVKITAPGRGLIALLRSEVKQSNIPWNDRNAVVFRPLRVFQSYR